MHEFAVYNPTYNLFAVVTMVAEFRASSGVFPYYYCDPLRLIMYHGPTASYQVCVKPFAFENKKFTWLEFSF